MLFDVVRFASVMSQPCLLLKALVGHIIIVTLAAHLEALQISSTLIAVFHV
jgi:hypothetical protein